MVPGDFFFFEDLDFVDDFEGGNGGGGGGGGDDVTDTRDLCCSRPRTGFPALGWAMEPSKYYGSDDLHERCFLYRATSLYTL